jgi:hypothetical protein
LGILGAPVDQPGLGLRVGPQQGTGGLLRLFLLLEARPDAKQPGAVMAAASRLPTQPEGRWLPSVFRVILGSLVR